MTKTHKAVLSTLAVLCLLFMGSGVAQAQVCDARSTSNAVRAEGITEVVEDLKVRCRVEGVFGLDPLDSANITVQLNTNITNAIEEDRLVTVRRLLSAEESEDDQALTNTARADGKIILFVEASGTDPDLEAVEFEEVTLSDDGTTLTWKLTAMEANLNGTTPDDKGFDFTISGIRANAASLGDGQDVTASVLVAGVSPANTSGPVKLAAVKKGLVIPVEVATGDQCADTETTATITIKEGAGIASAINDGSAFVITFRDIPEGVTVTVPLSVDSMDVAQVGADAEAVGYMAPVVDTFGITLVTGIASGTDGDGVVDLSAAGAGEAVYEVVDDVVEDQDPFNEATDPMEKDEWVELTVTFEWESADLMPANAMGTVNVSFDPVSAALGDTFYDERGRGAAVPRFITSDNTQDVLDISLCTTTLLFPFVTNQAGFDTGIAITNTSEEAGSCSISYHGGDGGDVWMTPEVAEEDHTVFLASATTPGFQGYIMATCGFRDAHGYAFITNGASTLAQGYLAVCTSCDDE